jgi:predicted acyltransferase
VRWLIAGGIIGIVAGYAWNPYFPINKNLWTSSYVLFTAGYAMLALAACYWVVDVRRWRPALLTTPFLALGTNAILAFSLSIFIAKNLLIYKMKMMGPALATGSASIATGAASSVGKAGALAARSAPGAGSSVRVVNAWTWIYLNWFAPLFAGLPAPLNDPRNASLLFALTFVAIVTMIMWVFYKRKIFLKV